MKASGSSDINDAKTSELLLGSLGLSEKSRRSIRSFKVSTSNRSEIEVPMMVIYGNVAFSKNVKSAQFSICVTCDSRFLPYFQAFTPTRRISTAASPVGNRGKLSDVHSGDSVVN